MEHTKPTRYKTKVLPLPYYLEVNPDVLAEELAEEYLEVKPVFNRNGLYMEEGYCWLELNGKAYAGVVDASYFNYKTKVTDENILRTTELEALMRAFQVTSDSTLRKALQKRLHEHYEAFELRDSYRMARKSMIKFYKENKDVE